jgi:choline-sulfatase
MRRARIWLSLAAAAGLAAGFGGMDGCGRSAVDGPNVVLILLDTLRADGLGSYGQPLRTSPHLDRLARRGTLFTRAYAQASWTKPSVASLLTSRYPTAHQALAGRAIDVGTPLTIDALSAELLTLPEAFSELGYETACLQTNVNVSVKPELGFAQGCALARMVGPDVSARAVSAEALEWVRARRRPFFLYAHYMEPHMPYTPPAPYERVFNRPGPTVELTYNTRLYRSIYDNVLNHNLGLHETLDPALVPTEAQLERLRGLYHGEIASMDAALAEMLEALLARGDTWVIVLSDHGEQFMDHGSLGHGQALYEELIRVPLVIAGPGVPAGGVVATPVELVDVFPTLMDRLGRLRAYPELQGRSVLPLLRGGTIPARPLYSEVDDSHAADTRPLRAVLDGSLKLIDNEFRTEGRLELYDLAADPAELYPLPAEAHPASTGLRERLASRRAIDRSLAEELPGAERVPLDKETIRELKALGYIQ